MILKVTSSYLSTNQKSNTTHVFLFGKNLYVVEEIKLSLTYIYDY